MRVRSALAVCLLAGAPLVAQSPGSAPAAYMSAADIQAGLSKLDPKLVGSRTGGAIPFADGKAPGVVRRRQSGPQYAITHTRSLEYMMVTKGTATLVTGGTLIPDRKSVV